MVRILQVFPVIFMMSVSIVAGIFVFSDDLSSWRGGTFGMFSSTDNRITRRIEVIAEIDGATQPLDLTPYRAQRDLVELLPTTPRLVAIYERRSLRRGPQQLNGFATFS